MMITNKQYKELVLSEKKLMMYLFQNGRHPTEYLRDIIKEFYGHKVKICDLINVIESGEL